MNRILTFMVMSISILCLSLLFKPSNLYAENFSEISATVENVSGEEISLYEDADFNKLLTTIPSNSIVTVLEVESPYAYVEFENEEGIVLVGYLQEHFIVEDATQDNTDLGKQKPDEQDAKLNLKDVHKVEQGQAMEFESHTDGNSKDVINDNEKKITISSLNANTATLQGIGLKDQTNVYASTSRFSDVLKAYDVGTVLKYKVHNQNWYVATVYVAGKRTTGYIHESDVDHLSGSNQTISGFALLDVTTVYASPSKDSKGLKSYQLNKKLKYQELSENWYQATVIINGVARKGYIYKEDVSASTPTLSGYAQTDITSVYDSPSKEGTILKSYGAGQLLKFRPYSNEWYEATVFIGGKSHKGYIYKQDIGQNIPTSTGYAQFEPIAVYDKTSKDSNVLKTYRAGSSLKFRPHNDNWYVATVIVDGQSLTGYIYKNDIGDKKPTLQGFPKNSRVNIYAGKVKSDTAILKSYRSGSLLKYRPHNSSWYAATVYVNGVAQTGYIHHDDIITATGKTIVLDAGHGGTDPGALGNGLREKDITLELALKTQKLLVDAGLSVIMTRETDTHLSLKQRTDLANSLGADLFFSIHVNAGGGQGIETFWQNSYEAKNSERLATLVQGEVIKETKTINRGVKTANLHVNRESKMPSSLIEVGFIDHKEDSEKLKSQTYKDLVVKGIVSAIKRYFYIL